MDGPPTAPHRRRPTAPPEPPRRAPEPEAADDDEDEEPARPGGVLPAWAARRTGALVVAVLVLLGTVVGGGLFVYNTYFVTPDFPGEGTGTVIVHVAQGDSGIQIGNELVERGVIASVQAFIEASDADRRSRSVQPGYYQLRQEMSAAAAIALMVDPVSRVGQLEIRGGVQLDDTSAPDGTVAPGVLSLISQATCVTQDGVQQCVSVDDLRRAMAETDPAALGVPSWALEAVAAAEPNRRLEGLLVPGRYDVPPGTPAVDVLRGLLATSGERLDESGIVAGAEQMGFSTYDVLTIASLVEKEAITPDMPRVSRVIYNRLDAGRAWSWTRWSTTRSTCRRCAPPTRPRTSRPVQQLPGDGPAADADRGAGAGGDPGALAPEPGPWFYFVRCQQDGTSCFAETFAQHTANVREAQASGAF
ncbi:hypothetical protein BJF78_35080 [Pseudonocardia sp. CNS-139]|nr:hypothetical protein BJF78_35080 [Pseudonocardia sp. CNS-139]